MSNFKILSGGWSELQSAVGPVREAVFIREQQIAPADEWDAQDLVSLHFAVMDGEACIATARLLENHSIGRVAVLSSSRGKGIGKLLMLAVIEVAKKQGRPFVKLSSQVHAIEFYVGLGFKVQGEEYLDCGIPHIDISMSFVD